MKPSKPGASGTARRPPVPTDSHADIEAWLGRQMPELQPVFLGGSGIDDPPPSRTGNSRYVKLRSVDEAEDPRIREWIEQAARVAGWK